MLPPLWLPLWPWVGWVVHAPAVTASLLGEARASGASSATIRQTNSPRRARGATAATMAMDAMLQGPVPTSAMQLLPQLIKMRSIWAAVLPLFECGRATRAVRQAGAAGNVSAAEMMGWATSRCRMRRGLQAAYVAKAVRVWPA